MAGASDPLEDMLFNEVDEKAVSDLVGSLESQLGDRAAPPASFSGGKREAAPAAAEQFSGKVRDQAGSSEPQQGHPAAGLPQEPAAAEPLSGKSSSAAAPGAGVPPGSGLQVVGPSPPGPGPITLPAHTAAASFPRAAVPGPSAAPAAAPPGPQGLNGGAARLAAPVISPVNPGALQRHPSPGTGGAQNGVELKGAPSPSGSGSPGLAHTKVLTPSLPVSGGSVILTSTPPPVVAQSQTGTGVTGVKPAVNGVAPAAVAVVRPPGAPVVAPTIQQQRPGLVATPSRAAAPQPALAVRPQQQTTIQLPQGFTMPPGESGPGPGRTGPIHPTDRVSSSLRHGSGPD